MNKLTNDLMVLFPLVEYSIFKDTNREYISMYHNGKRICFTQCNEKKYNTSYICAMFGAVENPLNLDNCEFDAVKNSFDEQIKYIENIYPIKNI